MFALTSELLLMFILSVSFPDLEKATGIILNWNWDTQLGESATVDFPSLTSVGEFLSLIGTLSRYATLPIWSFDNA